MSSRNFDLPVLVLARHALLRHAPRTTETNGYQLLLEGSWPESDSGTEGAKFSLDESVDSRFAWIDQQAARLAEQVTEAAMRSLSCWYQRESNSTASFNAPSIETLAPPAELFDDLNSLKLRYWFVKMLRVVAFLTAVCPLRTTNRVRLVVEDRHDDDYVALFESLCQARGVPLETIRVSNANMLQAGTAGLRHGGRIAVHHVLSSSGQPVDCDDRVMSPQQPATARRADVAPHHRLQLLRLTNRLAQTVAARRCHGPAVLLCGNPSVLDPVCAELRRRRHRIWWGYEQVAVRSAIRWAHRGIGQFICTSDDAPTLKGIEESKPHVFGYPLMQVEGVDLLAAFHAWQRRVVAPQRARLRRIWQSVNRWIDRAQPAAVVVSDDATALPRALVLAAKQRGIGALVVQHGAPCVRFGFAPLLADRIAVWGSAAQQQFLRWNIDAQRIALTGSVKARPTRCRRVVWPLRSKHQRLLVLDTVPPRDERPDAVEFHLTTHTYRAMVEMVCHVAAQRPSLSVTVRPHPRCPIGSPLANKLWHATAAKFEGLDLQVVGTPSLGRQLQWADVVISFASSAGIEAAWLGKPVIQVLPEGSADILPHTAWGLVGSARTATELDQLLNRCLNMHPIPPSRVTNSATSPTATGCQAAQNIVDEVAGLIAEHAFCNERNQPPWVCHAIRASDEPVSTEVARD